MDDLFESSSESQDSMARQTLAARMRPRSIQEVAGQEHILGPGKLLRRLVESDRLSSAIFYGPPGSGKTSVARAIGLQTKSDFVELSGVEASVVQIRKVVEQADVVWRARCKRTLLLVDEIHRFNKAQQDALLPHVERGAIRFIGATTENPSFYVNAALVSRSQIFEFKPLEPKHLIQLIQYALKDSERGLGQYKTHACAEGLNFLANICDGDARKALNALEIAVLTTMSDEQGVIQLTREVMEESIQKRAVLYDADGDQHYDTISAFIKTIRASEPDAAIYWLAKMLIAGEDPRFIARRLVILSSEDIGLADPHALPLSIACQRAVETLGMPEARIPLAETTVYLATAPKSNAAYMALEKAMSQINQGAIQEVPLALRDAHYKGAKERGHGKEYEYAHDFPEAITPHLTSPKMPQFYHPTRFGYEKVIAERLERWATLRKNRSQA